MKPGLIQVAILISFLLVVELADMDTNMNCAALSATVLITFASPQTATAGGGLEPSPPGGLGTCLKRRGWRTRRAPELALCHTQDNMHQVSLQSVQPLP